MLSNNINPSSSTVNHDVIRTLASNTWECLLNSFFDYLYTLPDDICREHLVMFLDSGRLHPSVTDWDNGFSEVLHWEKNFV